MNNIASKKSYITLLVGLLATLFITGGIIRLGYAQTNLQELQNRVTKRVAELEKKLADVAALQEKAYSVRMKLEEHEQKLASLDKSDELDKLCKRKVQITEIRADIKNIRTRIEVITKEKNDLEENLRLARNLLSEVQKIPTTEPEEVWHIENIQLDRHFSDNERKEILNVFSKGRQINQEDLLKGAYRIYNSTGTSMRIIIHPKSGNTADLEILLGQREDNPNSYFTFFKPMTLDQFKSERFNITIAR